MITEPEYWKDRESRYRMECTGAMRDSARTTIKRVNALLELAEAETGLKWDKCTSGWRPKSINDATANASKNSKHLTGQAADIADPDRKLAQWCIDNVNSLDACGLWIEDPRWSPTWVHFQIVPPKSGRRVYIPSSAPPKAPPLNGQKPIPGRIKT